MFVRPLRFETRLPVSVSQMIVSVSKPPVAMRLPSSLNAMKASACSVNAPLFGTFIDVNSRPFATSQSLTT